MYFQNYFLCRPEKILFFFKKFKHFPSYSDLELNFFGLLAAKSWKFGQTTVRCAQRNSLRKTLFYEEKTLSSFSNIEPNMFENWQFFLLRSINCKLRDQRSFFGKFPWRSSSYFIYFGLLAKTSRSVCQNCFLWALRIVLKDKGFFSKKIFSMFFGFGSNISEIFSEKFLVAWPNCRWKRPVEHFENNVFFWKKNLLFQTLRQKRWEKGKIFRLRSLNCIKRDQKNILRNFFWGLWTYSVILGLLAKTSVCQNCFHWALGIVLKKKSFSKYVFFP